MIERNYNYRGVRFSVRTVRAVLKEFKRVAESYGVPVEASPALRVTLSTGQWRYDNEAEFFAALPGAEEFSVYIGSADISVRLELHQLPNVAVASVKAKSLVDVNDIFLPMDESCESERIPIISEEQDAAEEDKVVVFIGHGRSAQWMQLRDHLQFKHHYAVECYEAGARAGHSIRDILESMINASSFALLVMTGEDEQADGALRARQNVIHEAGLFQGRLGFSRAIILLEDGVQEFSNVQGVQYIPFQKDNIKETFGEVLATIRREFHLRGR